MAAEDDGLSIEVQREVQDAVAREALWAGTELVRVTGSPKLSLEPRLEHHVFVIGGTGHCRLGETETPLEPGTVLHWARDLNLTFAVPDGVLTFLHQWMPFRTKAPDVPSPVLEEAPARSTPAALAPRPARANPPRLARPVVRETPPVRAAVPSKEPIRWRMPDVRMPVPPSQSPDSSVGPTEPAPDETPDEGPVRRAP